MNFDNFKIIEFLQSLKPAFTTSRTILSCVVHMTTRVAVIGTVSEQSRCTISFVHGLKSIELRFLFRQMSCVVLGGICSSCYCYIGYYFGLSGEVPFQWAFLSHYFCGCGFEILNK